MSIVTYGVFELKFEAHITGFETSVGVKGVW